MNRTARTLPLLPVLAAILGLLPASFCLAQGPLTPPDAPGPMGKTLDQLEARTPISSVPFTITQPGSYYVTANLDVSTGDAITINDNQVTLDLNGFTISSTAPSATGTAILLPNGRSSDITIFNGHIRGGVTNAEGGVYTGPGFRDGIAAFDIHSLQDNVRVSGVSVSGCLSFGIFLQGSQSTVVESCTVQNVGGFGIAASVVSHSTASNCGSRAIVADSASHCSGSSVNDMGLEASNAENCFGQSFGAGAGINATNASNCYGYSGSSRGIAAMSVSNCYGYSSLNRGIFADLAIASEGVCSGGSYGLFATWVASTCYGYSQSGTGINGYILIGCTGNTISYSYHYNMPP